MEFIVAGYEIIDQEPGLEGMYKAAELPGRICYGSQDKMAPGTAERFCNGLMKSNHGAPLEHATVYLKTKIEYDSDISKLEYYFTSPLDKYQTNKYSYCNFDNDYIYVTTNLRVLFENDWMDDLQYWCEPTKFHEKRVQVRFTVDRFTGEEFIRHRVASFNRESTRYVLFTKEKFGGGSIKYIIPVWMLDETSRKEIEAHQDLNIIDFCQQIIDHEEGHGSMTDVFAWMFALKACEWSYCKLTNDFGWKAEQARTVLPCAISSPLIKTASLTDWVHFFNLRAIGTTGKPHPQAFELADPLMEDFINRGLIKFDESGKLKVA
jgi:thymidylate synthase (FAD)